MLPSGCLTMEKPWKNDEKPWIYSDLMGFYSDSMGFFDGIYHLVMTNSLPWYRWPIEIDGLPSYKMDLSMANY